jgi:hypothetical protein
MIIPISHRPRPLIPPFSPTGMTIPYKTRRFSLFVAPAPGCTYGVARVSRTPRKNIFIDTCGDWRAPGNGLVVRGSTPREMACEEPF